MNAADHPGSEVKDRWRREAPCAFDWNAGDGPIRRVDSHLENYAGDRLPLFIGGHDRNREGLTDMRRNGIRFRTQHTGWRRNRERQRARDSIDSCPKDGGTGG